MNYIDYAQVNIVLKCVQKTASYISPLKCRLLTPGRFGVTRWRGRQQMAHWNQTAPHTSSGCCSRWAVTESSPTPRTLSLDQSLLLVWRQRNCCVTAVCNMKFSFHKNCNMKRAYSVWRFSFIKHLTGRQTWAKLANYCRAAIIIFIL